MFKIQQKKEENTHTYTHIHRQRQTDRQGANMKTETKNGTF